MNVVNLFRLSEVNIRKNITGGNYDVTFKPGDHPCNDF
jgi:hypothetical protein